jgi:hypothetical protein
MANGGGPFGIGNEILQGFLGNNTLRDYTHASRTFTTNSYELKPRFKFLFHVSFTINVQEIPYLRGVFGNDDIMDLSLLVKTVDLPKYNVATQTLNQYNRKRVVQTKIDYQPVTLTFHDDGGDNSRKLWYYYFSYYFKDPAQQYLAPNTTNGSFGASMNRQAGFGYNNRDIYNDILQVKDWGYSGESWTDGTSSNSGKPPFFRDIRIYGMDQRKYAEYVLVNPLISNWSHDQYDYSQGAGTMQHSMTINYETVKYYEGAIGSSRPDTNVQGFADPAHYDTTLSPIARPGGNQTVFGQGGLLDAGIGILEDLQSGTVGGLIGAVQTAGRTYNTLQRGGFGATARSEAIAIGTSAILSGIPAATRVLMNKPTGIFIPTPSTDNSSTVYNTPGFNPNA